MTDEKLDNGTLITDEVADKLVADVYAALEKGAYKIIPNPHGKTKPLQLSEQRRTALQRALAVGD
ncbi:hypothetical protein AGMMS50293_08100 [Spirochaetia bacterium]|nr:hypothetical protein AGMMS50293_08100 [Spirochaetia bacterium]